MSSESRDLVVQYVMNEVWGPSIPVPADALALPEPNSAGEYEFAEDQFKSKIIDPSTGDLIIRGTAPEFVYGTAVLHAPESWDAKPDSKTQVEEAEEDFEKDEDDNEDVVVDHSSHKGGDPGDDGFSLSNSQKRRPSAMGITFEPRLFPSDELLVTFSGAVYEKIDLKFGSKSAPGWKRKAFAGEHQLVWDPSKYKLNVLHELDLGPECAQFIGLRIRFRASGSENTSDQGQSLVATLVAKNIEKTSSGKDVFQSVISAKIVGGGYLEDANRTKSRIDEEQDELDHLYRHAKNYGTGHGTSVMWDNKEGEIVKQISSVSVPAFHQEVLDFDSLGSLSMQELGSSTQESAREILKPIVDNYLEWTHSESLKALNTSTGSEETIARLTEKARHIHSRILKGFNLITDPKNLEVFEAFKLANAAMYEQQRNGRLKVREWPRKSDQFSISEHQDPVGYFGFWRPFQIAFLLAVIPGLVDPRDESRDEIDLIFFPTGGGKTEAYLGASAFTILYRRLVSDGSTDFGVDVLMRYTLRLLTIQQFERSAGLICVLEKMRQEAPSSRLGQKPISIGVWLGAATTPNKRAEAIALLSKDKDKRKEDDANPFILSRCPICAAEFGWWRGTSVNLWRGYKKVPTSGAKATLRFVCSDIDCFYGDSQNPLPIWITDEDVYEERPSFILGTVDKFAQMAWKPQAKSLFNIDSSGERQGPPPSLIIQDELHLISGPLGSMVGLYEAVVEELCTDRRTDPPIKPKIVASTATTRKFEQQVSNLYGRSSVMLFPQAINRANETYFSSIKYDKESGEKVLGSLFLGLNPGTYGDSQTSAARVAAILRQAPNMDPEIESKGMDYYRTSVWFFNSLRELGMTLTLMQSVARDMIGGIRKGGRLPVEKASYPTRIMELTSRIDSTKVSTSLSNLAIKSWDTKNKYYDTCLASSIMEVGVDVPRLGLLTIMSQPKTTAQYIQVAGRVGRDVKGPGLIVMLYNTGRARDRSVYERFQPFHETVYAQVEPISVTPFAIEAMKHGLKSAIISLYRMTTSSQGSPSASAVDWEKFDYAVDVFRQRISKLKVSDQSKIDFERQVESLRVYWETYTPNSWQYSYQEEKGVHSPESIPSLMRGRREEMTQVHGDQSIQVMTSMRSVDGQTQLQIANPYAFTDGEE
jgi:hypothetical protein